MTRAAVLVVDDEPDVRNLVRILLERAGQLRNAVRGWDAMYVALAESLDATLLTADHRLARAAGPRCPIEVISDRE